MENSNQIKNDLENIQKKLLKCAPFPISTNIRKN
jgi:hypothetical protein